MEVKGPTPKRVTLTMEYEGSDPQVIELDPEHWHLSQYRKVFRDTKTADLVPDPEVLVVLTGRMPVDAEKVEAFKKLEPSLEAVPGNAPDDIAKARAKEVSKMILEAKRPLEDPNNTAVVENTVDSLPYLLKQVGEARKRSEGHTFGISPVRLADNPRTRHIGFVIDDLDMLIQIPITRCLFSDLELTEEIAGLFGKTPDELKVLLKTEAGRREIAGEEVTEDEGPISGATADAVLAAMWEEDAKLDAPIDDGELLLAGRHSPKADLPSTSG